jgi:hypothetical protein
MRIPTGPAGADHCQQAYIATLSPPFRKAKPKVTNAWNEHFKRAPERRSEYKDSAPSSNACLLASNLRMAESKSSYFT